MNVKVLISFSIAAGIIVFTIVAKGGDNPMALVDPKAALVVIGGTFASGAIGFHIERILGLLKIFFQRMLRGSKTDYRATIREMMLLADNYRSNKDAIPALLEKSKDPFVKEAMELLLDDFLSGEELEEVLWTRVNTVSDRYSQDAKIFEALGKYPPAMGLLGAVIGMVALLGSLGKPGAESKIGPAMSIALIATFYGIGFANLFVIPIGEHLGGAAKELRVKNSMIVEGVLLISKNTNPIVLAVRLNSFLLPNERLELSEIKQGA